MSEKECLPSPNLSQKDAMLVAPLSLAYLGDAVYELYVRNRLLSMGLNVRDMHKSSVRHVSAPAQAAALSAIKGYLTQDETAIAKRGRNAHAHHRAPRAASVAEYAEATGLEALVGYLYLTGDFNRLNDLLQIAWEALENA